MDVEASSVVQVMVAVVAVVEVAIEDMAGAVVSAVSEVFKASVVVSSIDTALSANLDTATSLPTAAIPAGVSPTFTVAVTALLEVFITEIVLS